MKLIKIIFLVLNLLISYISIGQLAKTEPPRSVKGDIIIRMEKGGNPYTLVTRMPAYLDFKVTQSLAEKSDIWLLHFNEDNSTKENAINLLLRDRTVRIAQPNRFVELRAIPNDPNYGNQWQHTKINSPGAWDITTGGKTTNGHDIVVALMESADVINHNDLKDNRWINTAEIPGNGIDDDGNGFVDDYNGWNSSSNNDNIGTGSHGTSCAGMIGAKGNNSLGVAGINWDVKIMVINLSSGTEAGVIAGYNYALQQRLLWNQTNGASGAFVVASSASWGYDGANPNDYPIWCGFYDDLGQAGILNVGATTNQNWNVDQTGDVPTACPSDYMVSVTATNSSDIIDFAGYGLTTIDIAAPGSSIYTTAPNNGYTSTSGTSFACPLTAGLIALMYSSPCESIESLAMSDPQGTADIVRKALFDGVDKTTYLQGKVKYGGRINAKKSIDTLMAVICNSCLPPLNIQTANIQENTAEVTFDGDGDNYTIYYQASGDINWLTSTSSTTSFSLAGLNSCTEYAYYIKSECSGEDSNPTAIKTFTTSGCGNCVDLNYCTTGTNDPATRLIVHNPASIAGTYAYEAAGFGGNVGNGYVYGELVLVDDGSANPTEGCNTLINSAQLNGNIAVVRRGTCPFTQKAINAQNAGAKAIIVVNNVAGAPISMGGTDPNVTIPAIMISQANGNTLINAINNNDHPMALLGAQKEWIESITLNGNVHSTGNNNGYYFGSASTAIERGAPYSLKIQPGFAGDTLLEYSRVWIDVNQDGVFDASEIVFDQSNASFGVVNGNFTLPLSTPLGSTRMRVQMAYQGYGSSALPAVCGTYTSGEIEDYCIEIIEQGTSGIESAILNAVTLYPNPANTQLTISNKNFDPVLVDIYSSNGQLLQSLSTQSENTIISTENWATGIYLIRISDSKAFSVTKKITIIH
ncbi:MAG: S8 family serine peptidase [Brumimicrobium sp.]|nr:S8 family serine peptidase [Brumimicrobium sp.]